MTAPGAMVIEAYTRELLEAVVARRNDASPAACDLVKKCVNDLVGLSDCDDIAETTIMVIDGLVGALLED